MSLPKYTAEQQANITSIILECMAKGIKNIFSQTSILSVVSKESNFIYKAEGSYKNTSNARIRQIFGTRLAKYTDAALTVLKSNDVNFFDAVYGYKSDVGIKNGNTTPGDGFKFRGRGPNQVTFANLYAKLSKQIGVDLITNPDLANDPKIAAKIVVQYFLNTFASAPKQTLSLYNSTGINDFKTLPDSLGAFYHANAGWGHSKASLDLDPTGGLKKAKAISNDFYSFVSNNKVAVASGGGGFFFTDNGTDNIKS